MIIYYSLICFYVTMAISTIIAMRIVMHRLDWPKIIVSGIGWPITIIIVLYLSSKEYDGPAAICSRCNGEIENIEDIQSGEDWGFGQICEACRDYLNNDEYHYDLKDQDGESRYEQREGK